MSSNQLHRHLQSVLRKTGKLLGTIGLHDQDSGEVQSGWGYLGC